jgi:uncharacterized pyridoxamine 5'-phosphate oxidase family protein
MSTMQELHDYLDKCGTFYLTTIDGDKPACRPISFHMIADDKEYFGVGTFKDVYRQILDNAHVQIVGCKGTDWIRISGTAVMDDNPALFNQAITLMPFLKNIYNKETGNSMGIFFLKDAKAEYVEQLMTVAKTVEF